MPRYTGLVSFALLWILGACSGTSSDDPVAAGGGSGQQGASGSNATAGGNPQAGAGGGSAGSATAGSATMGGQAPVAGAAGSAGTAVAGAAGAGGSGGQANPDPQPSRPIDVKPGDNVNLNFNGQSLFLNKNKPARGKLVLLLGGICTGTGAGGFESFVKQYGFHVFAPKTDTCLTGGSVPDSYKETIKTKPDDVEANRQVSDARMELWDGMDRVDWYEHSAAESILQETKDALNYAQGQDPGGDWAWFLNDDGSLRTTDVYVVGYSWGSQTWAMISSFVRFGRVICTSGPVAEGFPNGGWITKPGPNATPGDRKYILVDLKMPYPSEGEGNMEKFQNVIKAGWDDDVTSVEPTGTGTFTATQHLFAMIGSNNTSPGGHTVFCNDNPQNGWLPVCKHVLGVE